MPTSTGVNFTITRNEINDINWKLTRIDDLGEFSLFNIFCCGDSDLDEFIKEDAVTHKQELIVETYILRQASGGAPVAFVSFCNDSIPLAKLSRKSKKALPNRKRYSSMPAVKIARLGVKSDLQGKNVGTLIINMSKKFFITDNRTGCRFLTVDSYNKERVIGFYKKNDFQFLGEHDADKGTRIMYLDLKRLPT
jgi:ribosomal protein S18 acetylase RimI-like enzyme